VGFGAVVASNSAKLSSTELRVVDVLLGVGTSHATAAEIAHQARTHESTVVRLGQKLGYRGYPELRNDLRRDENTGTDRSTLMSVGVVPRHAVRPRSRAAMRRGVSWILCRKIDLVGHSVESECNRLVGRGLAVEIVDERHRHFLGHFHHDLPAIPGPTVLLQRHAFRCRNRDSYTLRSRVCLPVPPSAEPFAK
jgi:hypothetical protein